MAVSAIAKSCHSGPVELRRLTRADWPLVSGWLAEPHLKRWWNHDPSLRAVEADFGPSVDGSDAAEIFIESRGARPFGLIQRYTFADNPQYLAELAPLLAVDGTASSLDYFVGTPGLLGRGNGCAMIEAAVASSCRDYPQADAIVVPVVVANIASWRALERAGFKHAASGPLAPDNPVDDPLHHVHRIGRPAFLA